jgi:hypothetical protein
MSKPRRLIGIGATDALGLGSIASTPGADTSTTILGMTARTLTPITHGGTGTNFLALALSAYGGHANCVWGCPLSGAKQTSR